jgi:excisionase family DNA binding protein
MTAPDYVTTTEAARLLGWSDDSVLRAVRRGHLPAHRYGRMVRVQRAGLEEFLAAHTVRGDALGAQRRRRAS